MKYFLLRLSKFCMYFMSTFMKLLAGFLIIKVVAVHYGVESMGIIGQFLSFIAIVVSLSGGGIANGIVKYLSGNKEDYNQYLTAIMFISIFSFVIIASLLFVFSVPIAEMIFSTKRYAWLIELTAICQCFFVISNNVVAIYNANKHFYFYILVTCLASIAGFIAFYLLSYYCGFVGAIVGIICFYSLNGIFALLFHFFKNKNRLELLKFGALNFFRIKNLVKFSGLLIVSAITMQLAPIIIRVLVSDAIGWYAVGLWQAVSKLSDAYLQFGTLILLNYFYPLICDMDMLELKKTLRKVLLTACLAMCVIVLGVLLCRNFIITTIFSIEFIPATSLMPYQLLGDIFRVLAWIYAYVLLSRARIKLTIVCEFIQAFMYVGFTWLFLGWFSIKAPVLAFLITNFIYFIFMSYVVHARILRKGL